MEWHFNDVMFDGLLGYVFSKLFGCKDKGFLTASQVDKRWNRIFLSRHPFLQFIRGEFSNDMLIYPPFYYCCFPLFAYSKSKLSKFDRMNKMMENVIDEKQEQFILNNMFFHSFQVADALCNNDKISNVLKKLESLQIIQYNAEQFHQLPRYLYSDWTLLQACYLIWKDCPVEFVDQDDLTKPPLRNYRIYLPLRLQYEFYRIAVKHKFTYYGNIYHIPEELISKELCSYSVEACCCSLLHVPKVFMSFELCALAVKRDSHCIAYVPKELQTTEMCKLALQKDGIALQYIRKKDRTAEYCQWAFSSNSSAIRYIPCRIRTNEMFKKAIEDDATLFRWIPTGKITKEMCELVAQNKQARLVVQYAPRAFLTKEICFLAINENGRFLCANSKRLQDS